jgi:transposase InsO family protein
LASLVSVRLVQESLQRLKSRTSRRHRRHLEKASWSVTVLAKDAIWSQDGTHLGRTGAEAVEGQVIKDRGSLKVHEVAVGAPATSQDVLLLLKMAEKICGGLPLVWQTDNGSIYLSQEVQEYLREKRVVHLKSRVRKPQDNGASEICMRELKYESDLGKGKSLCSALDAAVRFQESAVQLNQQRLRGSRGYVTAQHLYETMPPWYNFVRRGPFYEETTRAVHEAVEGVPKRHARRAEREAIYRVMEKYGLIERSQGGRTVRSCELEILL